MATTPPSAAPRRVLATRSAAWAIALARSLGRIGVRPTGVSVAGIVFAMLAATAFMFVPQYTGARAAGLLVLASAGIQLRLLCNLLDGMLAVEEGFKSKTGELYNDLPDRVADVLILVGAGYASPTIAGSVVLGWSAATLALMTAYVRLLGGSLGITQYFIGPMAKQHRMFALTLAALAAAGETSVGRTPRALFLGLAVIVAGTLVTVVRRTLRIAADMNAR
jgi:phosphatidylglycerophosphate synthase